MKPFENYLKNLEKAAKILEIPKEKISKLKEANHVHTKQVKINLENGESKSFNAYRVQFSNARGIYKGGIRFHPEADLEEVKALAALMAIKCATVNIPLGGGKGGLQCNPKELSKKDLEKVSRTWVREMSEVIGSDKDCPAPDVYTNPEVMAWMMDEFEKIKGKKDPGVVTGKPIELGGSLGRVSATAQGGVYVLEEYVKLSGLDRNKLRVAVQGFGNAGFFAAKLLKELGYKIVAISDSKGGVYCEKGLECEKEGICPAEAMKLKKENGSLAKIKNLEIITNKELLECDCDILIPAALDSVITKENANKIKAEIILELANGPVTTEADEILEKNGALVIPDVLANAGGVTVSYFEWVQNKMGYYWTEEEIQEKLKPIMVKAFLDSFEMSRAKSISLRDACFCLAVERILKAEELRGRV